VPFVTELLQSLGNSHANEREPRRKRSQQSKVDLPSHSASVWQAIGDWRDTPSTPLRTGFAARSRVRYLGLRIQSPHEGICHFPSTILSASLANGSRSHLRP